jgi:hypothetical protein
VVWPVTADRNRLVVPLALDPSAAGDLCLDRPRQRPFRWSGVLRLGCSGGAACSGGEAGCAGEAGCSCRAGWSGCSVLIAARVGKGPCERREECCRGHPPAAARPRPPLRIGAGTHRRRGRHVTFRRHGTPLAALPRPAGGRARSSFRWSGREGHARAADLRAEGRTSRARRSSRPRGGRRRPGRAVRRRAPAPAGGRSRWRRGAGRAGHRRAAPPPHGR